MPSILCFGELLLRLSAPDCERLLQSPSLRVHVGGAEANVAAALAQFGHPVEMLGTVASNALGDAALGELRRLGVGTDRVRRAPGRMGLYFFEQGAILRPSEVLYDRENSAFARAAPDDYDWGGLLSGAARLHLSGVTPAIGPDCARSASAAAAAAVELGVPVSFDGNFRGKLWEPWNRDPAAVLRPLMASADVLFANHRDMQLVLGEGIDAPTPGAAFREAAERAFTAFPRLRYLSATARASDGVNRQTLTAFLGLRDGRVLGTRSYALEGIVDRIGTGDAFAAGFLYGLHAGKDAQAMLDFALASGALKHTIAGDMMRGERVEVERWMQALDADVSR